MIINKVFKEVGKPTTCGDLDFMQSVVNSLPLFSHQTAEHLQSNMIRLFESNHRYEYTVRDDNGKLLALMVITADDYDCQCGDVCLVVEMACSFKPGALNEAYRWVRSLARQHGINWIRYTRTDGYKITMDYKKIKPL